MAETSEGSGPPSGVTVQPNAGAEALPRPKRTANITSADMRELAWDADNLQGSLEGLKRYVLANAERSENWYWKRKANKARFAIVLQWTAIWATAMAGVVPVASTLGMFAGWSTHLHFKLFTSFNSGLFASLLIGGSAALLSVDRFAGLSSGWTRYVLTATTIRAASEEFRMDWAALTAQSATPPTVEQSAAMIQRAKVFSLVVEALVIKETQDWATEFRQNLMMLERDLKVQIDQSKVDREKADQDAKTKTEQEKAKAEREKADKEQAAQPGAIDASVSNASATDDFQFEAKLENKSSIVATEPVKGAESWTKLDVPPGQYKLTITGIVKKRQLASSTLLVVKPGATTDVKLALPTMPSAESNPQ
jgi:hypothetical protein